MRTNWPFPPNPRFKGRMNEISQLRNALMNQETVQVAVICGPGGIGKTSLALQYCRENEASHSYIIWAHAKSKKNLEDAYIWFLRQLIDVKVEDAPQRRPDFEAIARELGLQGILKSDGTFEIGGEDAEQRTRAVQSVIAWLERQRDHSWLIVFDEVDNVEIPVTDFIPRCAWGSYLITTRRTDVRDYGTCGLDLDGLTVKEGKELLLHGTRRDSSNPEGELEESEATPSLILSLLVDQDAEEIVTMLDRHPLAIDQAGAYLRKRPFMTLRDYIQAFRNKVEEIQPREVLLRNENLWPDYNLTCMTTFEISREAIQAEMSDAIKVLQLCC
jgi:AAA ATPase domain